MCSDTSSEASAARGAEVRTFLIADVRGYTRYTRERGDDAASRLAALLADVVRGVVPEFHGELLELRGDEAVSVFRSAREAIRSAVALQRELRRRADGEPVFPLGVGMGIDSGEAVPTEGGYRGGALNLAARLCAIAKPGQILASDHAAHLAGRVDGVRLQDRRPVRLKGMPKPVRLVEVVSEAPLPPLPPPPPRRSRKRRNGFVAALVIGLAVSAATWVAVGGSRSATPAAAVVVPRVGSVAVIDPRTGALVADYPIPAGASPAPIVFGGGALWTYNQDRQTLIRIDPTSGEVRQVGIGVQPTDIVVAYGYVWLAAGFDNEVVQVDTAMANVHPIPLPWPHPSPGHVYSLSGQITAFRRTIWATARGIEWPQTVVSISPHTLSVRRWLYVGSQRQIGDIASGPPGVWMENRTNGPNSGKAGLASVAPQIGRPIYVGQGGYLQQGVAVGRQYVWFAGGQGTTIFALNTTDGSFQPVSTPCTTTALVPDNNEVWAACANGGTVFPAVPTNPRAGHQIHLRRYVNSIAFAHDRIWALVQSTPVAVGNVF